MLFQLAMDGQEQIDPAHDLADEFLEPGRLVEALHLDQQLVDHPTRFAADRSIDCGPNLEGGGSVGPKMGGSHLVG